VTAGDSSLDEAATDGGYILPPAAPLSTPTGDGGDTPVPAHLTSLPTGLILANRYQIVRSLGEGGMGSVYEAKDLELDRVIALKVIRPELAAHPAMLQRFNQEIIVSQRVTHQNVVRIFDLGVSDELRFITMEYVAGRDLRTLMGSGHSLSVDQSVDIAVQVCRALDAAHRAGVVHRDLKPQNIMIDAEGRARVMDFGIAHSADLTRITRTMLVGSLPFEADTPMASLLKRTLERADPPSKHAPEIPGHLNDVVVRCLET